ncbi:MAG TPA: hypothetical protein VHT91_10645 [Kofleriaceae bacterium]|jgi:hypothetical protein|nr:hypothetical protein [Kofleriaceae bacterium]
MTYHEERTCGRSHRARIPAVVAAVLIAGGAAAHAQSLPLPRVDNVNFFFQAGSLIGSHDLVDDPSSNEKTFGELGWGFETSFDMLTSPDWDIELAVGYDQMFLRSKFVNKYGLRGTIRNLPALTIYASSPNGLYAGFGTGLVSLSNVSAFLDGHRQFTVGGDTFDLTAKIGVSKDLGDKVVTKYSRANLFVELAYHARFLGNVSYGMGAPDTLPGSLFFGGVVVSVGAQVSLRPSAGPSDDDIKKEIAKQNHQVTQASTPKLITHTACASANPGPDYVPIDDYWDPTRCGAPAAVEANVWVLAELPERTQADPHPSLEVCAFGTTPAGWTVVSERWDPTRCGRPGGIGPNIRLIRKDGPEKLDKPDKPTTEPSGAGAIRSAGDPGPVTPGQPG